MPLAPCLLHSGHGSMATRRLTGHSNHTSTDADVKASAFVSFAMCGRRMQHTALRNVAGALAHTKPMRMRSASHACMSGSTNRGDAKIWEEGGLFV